MLIVSSIDGSQVEPLTHHQGLKIEEEVNGSFVLSLTSFNVPENPGHELLIEECFVIVEGQEFRVKQLNENQYSKSVVAIHTFYDLADYRQDTIYGGTHTLAEFATFTLNGTGWAFTTDITGSALIENYGDANIISLINALCAAYQCEYQILPNKVIHFAYEIGPDNDAVYRYKHNVVALSKKVDTTKLKTFIEGYGANGLKVSYTSSNSETFGIRKAEPISDDRFTQESSLVEYLKTQIVDVPEATFELNSVELINKQLGERIWLIYEPMHIEFQTRVLKHTREYRNGKLITTSVVLGNTLPKSTEDILVSQKVEIDASKKETRSRFEQTNEEIELAVERIGEAEATLTIHANEITSKVSQTDYNGNTIASLINQTATTIDIVAERINFVGQVFGEGAIFKGNIETLQNIKVGADITLQGNSGIIRFTSGVAGADRSYIGGTATDMTIEAPSSIDVVTNAIDFNYATVDFSSATISWGNNKPTAVWG